MTTDSLAVLLLDPFLTTGEVERELAALRLVRTADADRRTPDDRPDRPRPTGQEDRRAAA